MAVSGKLNDLNKMARQAVCILRSSDPMEISGKIKSAFMKKFIQII
jgi:hypothetical protein